MDETTYTLTQKRFLCGRLTLTIAGGKFTSDYRQGLSRRVYRFDLRGFLPDPVRTRHVPIWRITGAVLVFAFAMIYVAIGVGGITTRLEDTLTMFTVAGALLVLGAAASASAAQHAVNAVVFHGPAGPIVVWPGLPNREEFDKFLSVLIDRIKEARDYEKSLLRQLREADVINDWQYDQALELLACKKDHPETL